MIPGSNIVLRMEAKELNSQQLRIGTSIDSPKLLLNT